MRIIAGKARGTRIEAPEGRNTRPTLDRVRENLFNVLQTRIQDSRVLDLFAGSGALGLEAVSRGAAEAVLVDHSRKAQAVLRSNTAKLRFEDQIRIIPADWRDAAGQLAAEGKQFDLIFLDPPYAVRDLKDVFEALISLTAPAGLVILEHEAKAEDINTGDRFRVKDVRKWGYCGVTIYERGEGT